MNTHAMFIVDVYDYTEKMNFVKTQNYTINECISMNNCGIFCIFTKTIRGEWIILRI